jgi:MFS family permease
MPRRPFYGWTLVAVAFVTMGIAVNARTAFALLFPPLLAEFGWERGVTAAAFTLGFVVSSVYAVFLGAMMDRWGPRVVLPLGVLMMGAGLALTTRVTAPWHLHASFGLLVVTGSMAISCIGHSLFLPNWFVRRRGLAIGIAFSGVGVIGIVLLPWVQQLIAARGWRHACWVLAIVPVAALLPLNAVFPRQRPEELGLHADGAAGSDRPGGRAATEGVADPAWAASWARSPSATSPTAWDGSGPGRWRASASRSATRCCWSCRSGPPASFTTAPAPTPPPSPSPWC